MRAVSRWLVYGSVALCAVVALLAAGTYWFFLRPSDPLHDSAVADAAAKVDAVEQRFDYDHIYKADDFVHSAGQHPDVTVLSVRGETHWQTGVTLVLRVVGHGVELGADRSVIDERDVPICFRLELGPDEDSRDDDIDCPAVEPVPVSRDPSLRGVDDRLAKALEKAEPMEASVRAALAGLGIDPAVRQEVLSQGGQVGVALRAAQYDCLMARVTADGARLWRPSHTQLAPGELSCSAQVALSGVFGRN
ncbi:hypothetical protein [Micromonospora haikouensis]|uniref:hypothetical protein n=1 Tax=Micromonospora haikouensis TaxID=686309 RepID=UPI003D7500CD